MPDKGRTVKIDGDEVKRLRIARGWRVEDLAVKAKCSIKTVGNVEHGASIYLFTLSKFAEALGVECISLMAGKKETATDPVNKHRRFEVQVKLSIPYNDFDESEQLIQFVKALRDLLKGDDDMNVTNVEDGSVVITLEMSEENVARLFKAHWGGLLEQLSVTDCRKQRTVTCPSGCSFSGNLLPLWHDAIPEWIDEELLESASLPDIATFQCPKCSMFWQVQLSAA